MAARPPQAAGEVKYGYVIYVIVTVTVDSQRDVTHLVQLPATDCLRECSLRVH